MSYVLSRKAEEDIIDIFETGIEQFGLSQNATTNNWISVFVFWQKTL
jgi:plasmid stabilization system protein ParE